MFDREKQIVISRYSKAIFSDKDKISITDLHKLSIPESIKIFFEKEIENEVEQEFREIKKFSKFDYNHHLVKPIADELKVLLKFTRKFDLNEFSLFLKLALDLNLDYLLKPCDTLTNFVFKYNETQNVDFIKERLKLVTEYEYFPILISEYFNRKNISRISKNDFLNLLHKIEAEFSKNFTILDHYNVFSRFKSFLLELDLFINDYPEYEAFIIHLKDKNHIDIAKFLEEHKEHFRTFGGSVSNFLQSLLNPAIIESTKQELETSQEFNLEKSALHSSEVEKQESVQLNQGTSIIDEFENLSQEVEVSNSSQTKILVESEEKTTKSNLYEKLTTPISSSTGKKVFDRNLDGLMPARLKKKIIKKIFDNNEFSFAEFMNSMNKVENWDEASVLLTDLFDKKNIQPFSKWAIKLTEFLYENIK